MALASASTSELSDSPLKLILVHNKDQVSDAIDDIERLIQFVDSLSEKDVGVHFNRFDPAFSERDNKISMVVKEVQKLSITIMDKNIENAIENYGLQVKDTYLSLSGGFVLNCPTNSHIMNKYKFKGFVAPPCVNDAGMSLGIALYAFYKKSGTRIQFTFENAYYGEPNNGMSEFLKKYGDYIEDISDIDLNKAIDDIMDSPIVWFNGNSEVGPRALGNRSLIADPRTFKTKDILNEVKLRQWWRPVAPIIMEEEVNNWFVNSFPTQYMLHTFMIREERQAEIPAILHLDGSARIQTVNAKNNSLLYELLKAFQDRTHIPILCNTSLNDRGEPIINTLDEMINFILRKKISVGYVNGKRILFRNHEKFDTTEVAPRRIDFNEFNNELIGEEELKRLNPYGADMELLKVYIQNPKLYEKIDLTKKESIRILEGIVKLRKGKFHIL